MAVELVGWLKVDGSNHASIIHCGQPRWHRRALRFEAGRRLVNDTRCSFTHRIRCKACQSMHSTTRLHASDRCWHLLLKKEICQASILETLGEGWSVFNLTLIWPDIIVHEGWPEADDDRRFILTIVFLKFIVRINLRWYGSSSAVWILN